VAAFVLLLLCTGAASTVSAQEASREEMRSLDEQVQEIKSEVLEIASELRLLEEKLLHPSNTQVAVFVSLEGGEDVQLGSVEIRIDGESVAHHLYRFEELEALRKGGVQRIYTGNVPTGEHQLEVAIAGEVDGGGGFRAIRSFGFRKEAEPELLGVVVAGGSGDPRIRLGGW